MTVEAAAIIVATGYDVFDAKKKPVFGYLRNPDVITSLELERMINAGGPTGGQVRRLSTGKEPKSIIFIQCVGSRDMPLNRPYCSCVCCMQAIKNAMLIKEKHPEIEVTIFYMDVRAYGKGYEEYYERAKSVGVKFLRGMPPEVQADGRGMRFVVENTETGEGADPPPGARGALRGNRTDNRNRRPRGKTGHNARRDRVLPVCPRRARYRGHGPARHLHCRDSCRPKGHPRQRNFGRIRCHAGFCRYEETHSTGAVEMKEIQTLWWDDELGGLRFIDQTLLPEKYAIVRCTGVDRLVTAIKRLEVRGAPALGVAGGYGVALAAANCPESSYPAFVKKVTRDALMIRESRPTAVNLSWGVDRVLARVQAAPGVPDAKAAALAEAKAIAAEDTRCCHAIGSFRGRSPAGRVHRAHPLQCRGARLFYVGDGSRRESARPLPQEKP